MYFEDAVARDVGLTVQSFLNGSNRSALFVNGSDSSFALERLKRERPDDWQQVRATAVANALDSARNRIGELQAYAEAKRTSNQVEMQRLRSDSSDIRIVEALPVEVIEDRISNLESHVNHLQKYYIDTPSQRDAADSERRSRERAGASAREERGTKERDRARNEAVRKPFKLSYNDVPLEFSNTEAETGCLASPATPQGCNAMRESTRVV